MDSLLELLNASESKLDEESIEIADAGSLNLTTGKISVFDPLAYPEDKPLNQKVNPGKYPVKLFMLDGRPAVAAIFFKKGNVEKLKPAVEDGDDESDAWGYGVDAGMGCFVDSGAATKYKNFMDKFYEQKNVNFYDDLIELEMKKNENFDWLDFHLPDSPEENIIMFTSGYGDGVYSSFWGYDKDGEIVCLATNFEMVVDNPEIEKPKPKELTKEESESITKLEKALDEKDVPSILKYDESFRELIKQNPKDMTLSAKDSEIRDKIRDLAEEMFNNGKFQECLDLALLFTKRSQSSFHLYLPGRALRRLGRYEEAAENFRKCLELDPKDKDYLFMYAVTLKSMNKTDEAEKVYLDLINYHPDYPNGFINLSDLYFTKGDYEKAEEFGRKATIVGPEESYAWGNLADALEKLDRKEEAEEARKKQKELE